MDIEQITDEAMGLELTEDNIEDVLDEIRPYLVGELLQPVVTSICSLHFLPLNDKQAVSTIYLPALRLPKCIDASYR